MSNLPKDCVRQSGGKHIDVWTDGKIYPVDPTTMSTPNFSNATTLLKFAGDGYTGLLEYYHNLLGDKHEISNSNCVLMAQNDQLMQQ